MAPATQPAEPNAPKPSNVLVIAPSFTDPVTRQTYIHQDLTERVAVWDVEAHIPPISRTERFGDVTSWTDYVKQFSTDDRPPFLTWCERGLSAVLDYHFSIGDEGRCQWIAEHNFQRSAQWLHWERLANGQAIGQKRLIEALEDYAEDIVVPGAGQLLTILRTLRSTSMATGEVELRPDGTTSATWTKNNSVKAGELDIPPEFAIQIPVLKGHLDEGAPVLYRLPVRLRVGVDDTAHLSFRLSMPTAERTLEAVYDDRVAAAAALLGDEHRLYRAAER